MVSTAWSLRRKRERNRLQMAIALAFQLHLHRLPFADLEDNARSPAGLSDAAGYCCLQ